MSRAGFLAAQASDAALIASEAEPVTYEGLEIRAVIAMPSTAENIEGVHGLEATAHIRVVDVPAPAAGDMLQDEAGRIWRVGRAQAHGRNWWRLALTKWT